MLQFMKANNGMSLLETAFNDPPNFTRNMDSLQTPADFSVRGSQLLILCIFNRNQPGRLRKRLLQPLTDFFGVAIGR